MNLVYLFKYAMGICAFQLLILNIEISFGMNRDLKSAEIEPTHYTPKDSVCDEKWNKKLETSQSAPSGLFIFTAPLDIKESTVEANLPDDDAVGGSTGSSSEEDDDVFRMRSPITVGHVCKFRLSPQPLASGQTSPSSHVCHPIGSGGFGLIYKGRHPEISRAAFALKVANKI